MCTLYYSITVHSSAPAPERVGVGPSRKGEGTSCSLWPLRLTCDKPVGMNIPVDLLGENSKAAPVLPAGCVRIDVALGEVPPEIFGQAFRGR